MVYFKMLADIIKIILLTAILITLMEIQEVIE